MRSLTGRKKHTPSHSGLNNQDLQVRHHPTQATDVSPDRNLNGSNNNVNRQNELMQSFSGQKPQTSSRFVMQSSFDDN